MTPVTVDLSEAPKFALVIIEKINAAAPERIAAMFVGGCVRDLIVGDRINDWDIATTMLPSEITSLFKNEGITVVPTGLDHGTVTIVDPNTNDLFEVTTLRKDVSTDGRRATVEFTKSWKEDAQRRDLTFNALFCDLFGRVHDFVGGVDDLDNRVVRFVGNAQDRINEDFLRVIRLVRFAARLNCEIPETTRDILRDPRIVNNIVDNVSRERIWDELKKIAKGPNPKWAVETLTMIGTNRQTGVFPGLIASLGISATVTNRLNTTRAVFRQVDRQSNGDVEFPSLVLWINGIDPTINEKFPISADEFRQFKLWESFFNESNDRGINIEWLKDVIFDNRNNAHFRRSWLIAAVDSLNGDDNNSGMQVFVRRWNVPNLPVNGEDALELGFRGVDVGRWLAKASVMFRSTDFTATREDLLDELL